MIEMNKKGRAMADPAFALLKLAIGLLFSFLLSYEEWSRPKNVPRIRIDCYLNEINIFGI
jgi:hypothetical protein